MTFWRTASGAEVDLILGDAEVALEIKSSESVTNRVKGLHKNTNAGKALSFQGIPCREK
jgi:hypothetical protein